MLADLTVSCRQGPSSSMNSRSFEKLAAGHSSPGYQQETGVGNTGRPLAIPKVVSRHTRTGCGQQQTSIDNQQHSGNPSRHDEKCAEGYPCQLVTFDSEVSHRFHRCRSHDHGRVPSQRTQRKVVLAPAAVASQDSMADPRDTIQARNITQVLPSRTSPANGLQQKVLSATYHSGCNHCYVNTWVRALASAFIDAFGDACALGSFLQCVMQCHDSSASINGKVHLMQPDFLALLDQWPQPDIQNDIFEFAEQFIHSAGIPQVFGKWEFRMTMLGTSESGTEGESCLFTFGDMHLTRTYGCNGSLSRHMLSLHPHASYLPRSRDSNLMGRLGFEDVLDVSLIGRQKFLWQSVKVPELDRSCIIHTSLLLYLCMLDIHQPAATTPVASFRPSTCTSAMTMSDRNAWML